MLSKRQLAEYLESLATPLERTGSNLYRPEIDDLFFLYSLVHEKAVTSILEFGSGWSTCVLALALQENLEHFGTEHKSHVRHPNPFLLLTIDASEEFQKIALLRIPKQQLLNIRAVVSIPLLTQFNGVICHKFDGLPNFSPDFIYLDGPDHDQVIGDIQGFKYLESFTQPMGADILAIEPFLWPETIIVTDGRTANARFLAARLKREWQILHDPFGDRTIFRLNETALGLISEQHINFRLNHARAANAKESPERIN